jgi:hypothetical protein
VDAFDHIRGLARLNIEQNIFWKDS